MSKGKYFIPGLPIQYDADQALALWNQLIEVHGVIEDFVNRVGLAAALKQEAASSLISDPP